MDHMDMDSDTTTYISIYDACSVIEGWVEPDSEQQIIEAWQALIDTGYVWSLQGSYGRQATALINEGICRPAK
jgi:hypothetical protein